MSKFAAALAALLVVSPAIRAAELTLLEAAENNEHASAMRLVTAKGTNVNATTADGATALMYEIGRAHV